MFIPNETCFQFNTKTRNGGKSGGKLKGWIDRWAGGEANKVYKWDMGLQYQGFYVSVVKGYRCVLLRFIGVCY